MPTSEAFKSFAQMLVSRELAKTLATSPEKIEHELWIAAQYDWFIQTGAVAMRLSDGGLPPIADPEYAVVIEAALKHHVPPSGCVTK